METIKFGKTPYKIVTRFYKTKGSHNQKITKSPNRRTDNYKSYYIVKKDGQKFWVKEYIEPETSPCWGNPVDEYNRLVSIGGFLCRRGNISVRAVKVFAFENNCILMEYLSNHQSLKNAKINHEYKCHIARATREYVKKSGLADTYDLSSNNIMVGPSNSDIVLIDFEMAGGVDRLGYK